MLDAWDKEYKQNFNPDKSKYFDEVRCLKTRLRETAFLTKGLKISGTGAIDINGDVSSIGGVKYKLRGAVKNKADVFLVPAGENYEEAIKLQKKYNYDIDIVSISNFDEAVKYLKNK